MRLITLAMLAVSAVPLSDFSDAWAQALPGAPGRDAVEAVCSSCHGVELIRRSSGYSRDDWDVLTAAMIDLSGDPETRAAILDYLAAAFPPSQHRASTQAAGDMTLRFEEWGRAHARPAAS